MPQWWCLNTIGCISKAVSTVFVFCGAYHQDDLGGAIKVAGHSPGEGTATVKQMLEENCVNWNPLILIPWNLFLKMATQRALAIHKEFEIGRSKRDFFLLSLFLHIIKCATACSFWGKRKKSVCSITFLSMTVVPPPLRVWLLWMTSNLVDFWHVGEIISHTTLYSGFYGDDKLEIIELQHQQTLYKLP